MPLRTSSAPLLHRLSPFFHLSPDSDPLDPSSHVPPSHFLCMSPRCPSSRDDLRFASSSRGSGLSRALSGGDLSLHSLALQLDMGDRKEPLRASSNGSRRRTKRASPVLDVENEQASCSVAGVDSKNSDTATVDGCAQCVSAEVEALNSGAAGRDGPVANFRGDDGELYTSIEWSSSGHPLACNEKGCRPLTHPECRKLGLLASEFSSGDGAGSGRLKSRNVGTGGGDNGSSNSATEAYYQKLLQSDPQNPLLLRNYAQFLLERKGDFQRSEEYYGRAILAEPNDGEVLSQYAQLQWNLHGDKDRAETYYEQALQAAPEDCYVMASYASFLWDTEEEDDGNSSVPSNPPLQHEGVSTIPTPLLASA